MPTHVPLLFTFRDKVEGDTFLADVSVAGRALAVEEDDGRWWVYGVQPGAIAGGGTTLLEAFGDFRRGFTAVLFDAAAEAGDFSAFEAEVRRFFHETDPTSTAEWTAAVQAVRERRMEAADRPLAPDGLREERADAERYVTVERKQRFRAADNILDPRPAIAA